MAQQGNADKNSDISQRDLRKLKRSELLEIMLAQSEEIDSLRKQLAEKDRQLHQRAITIEHCGSIAEASLRLTRVFEEAQAAADLYLANVKARATGASPDADSADAPADDGAVDHAPADDGAAEHETVVAPKGVGAPEMGVAAAMFAATTVPGEPVGPIEPANADDAAVGASNDINADAGAKTAAAGTVAATGAAAGAEAAATDASDADIAADDNDAAEPEAGPDNAGSTTGTENAKPVVRPFRAARPVKTSRAKANSNRDDGDRAHRFKKANSTATAADTTAAPDVTNMATATNAPAAADTASTATAASRLAVNSTSSTRAATDAAKQAAAARQAAAAKQATAAKQAAAAPAVLDAAKAVASHLTGATKTRAVSVKAEVVKPGETVVVPSTPASASAEPSAEDDAESRQADRSANPAGTVGAPVEAADAGTTPQPAHVTHSSHASVSDASFTYTLPTSITHPSAETSAESETEKKARILAGIPTLDRPQTQPSETSAQAERSARPENLVETKEAVRRKPEPAELAASLPPLHPEISPLRSDAPSADVAPHWENAPHPAAPQLDDDFDDDDDWEIDDTDDADETDDPSSPLADADAGTAYTHISAIFSSECESDEPAEHPRAHTHAAHAAAHAAGYRPAVSDAVSARRTAHAAHADRSFNAAETAVLDPVNPEGVETSFARPASVAPASGAAFAQPAPATGIRAGASSVGGNATNAGGAVTASVDGAATAPAVASAAGAATNVASAAPGGTMANQPAQRVKPIEQLIEELKVNGVKHRG